MSLISTAYDSLIVRIKAKLPEASGWTRIPHAYDVESNSDLMLRMGWGVTLNNQSVKMGTLCNYQTERTIGVVISRECMFTDHDADGVAEVEKQLMEDLHLIVKDFETNQMLNDGAMFTGYTNDGGIVGIRNGDGKPAFIYLRAEFTLRLIQAL